MWRGRAIQCEIVSISNLENTKVPKINNSIIETSYFRLKFEKEGLRKGV